MNNKIIMISKRSHTKTNIVYDSIYTKLGKMQTDLTVTYNIIVVAWRWESGRDRRKGSSPRDQENLFEW